MPYVLIYISKLEINPSTHRSPIYGMSQLWKLKRSGTLSIWECLQLTNAIAYKTSELPYSLLKLKELISYLYSALKK